MPGSSASADEFWEAAAPLLEDGRAQPGTIMGGECLRAGKEFVAMPHHKGPGIVVKLPRERVTALIEAGQGRPFSPNGRVFREWLLVEDHDPARWTDLLLEAHAFVTGS
ncbi:MAG: hypothetical protein R3C39_03180 [Dehalococcoidia bacterium]